MPSKGGYLSCFTNIFEITMCSNVCPIVLKDNKINVYEAHHFPDSRIFLTPDLYAKEDPTLYPNPKKNCQDAQDYYITKLNEAPSNRVSGRQYIKHSYYHDVKQCFPDAFTIDLSMFAEDEQVLICIVTKTDKLNQVVEQTTVKIQWTKSHLWEHIKNVGKHIVDECNSKKSKVYAVRDDPLTEEECEKIKMPFGFEGAMYAVGKHVNHYAKNESSSQNKYVYYKGTPDLMPGLSRMSQSLCHMFSHHFHWESVMMKRTMQSFDEMPPVCMGGKLGMTKSMNVSINLANPAHYDV